MSWHEAVSLEIQVELYEFGGGDHYDRLTDAMHARRERVRQWHREAYQEAYSRLPTRNEIRARNKRKRERDRHRIVALRHCCICRQPYHLTALDRYDGRKCRLKTCSRQCGLLASGRHSLIEINGRRLTLRGWCLHFGVSRGTVEHRIKVLDMSPIEALTTPRLRNGGARKTQTRKSRAA